MVEQELQHNNEKYKIADREGRISIVVNTLLFILKYWAGVVSGSIALMADAWHTLSDSLSSLVLLIGMKKSRAKPDCNHPYGHERYELIAALIIGILLAVVAFEFLVESIQKIFSEEKAVFGVVAISVTVTSVIAKEALARYSLWGAKKTGLSALKAEGWHHRSDAISSLVILVGIFLKPFIPLVDELLGIAVAMLLFHASYEVIKDSVSPLIGEAPSPKLLEEITEICHRHAGKNCGAHHFHIHEYGSHIELTFHVRLDGNMSVTQAHDCVTAIEQDIRREKHIFATIHPEPLSKA